MDTNEFSAIQKLLSDNPALIKRLEGSVSRQETSHRLAAIAVENGIRADAGEIDREIERRVQEATTDGELSSNQLEAIAGGGNDGSFAIALSMLSVGLGCAIASIDAAANGLNCGKHLKSL